MGLNDIIQKNSMVVAIAAVIVIAGSVVFLIQGGKPSLPDQVWFYDLGDGQLFPADRSAVSPIEAPSGGPNRGVKAMVYSCGSCSESEISIVFLSKYTPEARAAMQKADDSAVTDPAVLETLDGGRLVALAPPAGEEPQWVSAMSPAGTEIVSRAGALCGKGEPLARPCFP